MSRRQLHIVVPPNQPSERIDKFLAVCIEEASRSQIQKWIEEQLVRVNGVPVKQSYLVHPGEEIHVEIPEPRKLELVPQNIPLAVLFEDEHLLVIDKPAGLVVHPAVGHPDGTLVNALLYHCNQLSEVSGETRPGIVHRLDKDTSGLMVIAKDDYVHRKLSEQFSSRTIERSYVAVVWGHFEQKTGRIETFFGRSPTNRKKMAVLSEGKLAITEYRVLEELPLISVVECQLKTGRTHQIRVHMAHLGHPVVGDYVYGGKRKRVGSLKAAERPLAQQYLEKMPRQALHARTLGFVHPRTGEKLYFVSELPEDMRQFLEFARSVQKKPAPASDNPETSG